MKNFSFKSLWQKGAAATLGAFVSLQTWAAGTDLLADVMKDSVEGSLGGSSMFWKIFILVDIVLAAAAAVKTKNPLVFGGVFFIAFIPGILVKTFVFSS